MPKDLNIGINAFIFCFILILISYWFADKPVVFWLAAHHSHIGYSLLL